MFEDKEYSFFKSWENPCKVVQVLKVKNDVMYELFTNNNFSRTFQTVWTKHGTSTMDPYDIISNVTGFDPDIGSSGFYGVGTYFSDLRQYSQTYEHKYKYPNSSLRAMIIVQNILKEPLLIRKGDSSTHVNLPTSAYLTSETPFTDPNDIRFATLLQDNGRTGTNTEIIAPLLNSVYSDNQNATTVLNRPNMYILTERYTSFPAYIVVYRRVSDPDPVPLDNGYFVESNSVSKSYVQDSPVQIQKRLHARVTVNRWRNAIDTILQRKRIEKMQGEIGTLLRDQQDEDRRFKDRLRARLDTLESSGFNMEELQAIRQRYDTYKANKLPRPTMEMVENFLSRALLSNERMTEEQETRFKSVFKILRRRILVSMPQLIRESEQQGGFGVTTTIGVPSLPKQGSKQRLSSSNSSNSSKTPAGVVAMSYKPESLKKQLNAPVPNSRFSTETTRATAFSRGNTVPHQSNIDEVSQSTIDEVPQSTIDEVYQMLLESYNIMIMFLASEYTRVSGMSKTVKTQTCSGVTYYDLPVNENERFYLNYHRRYDQSDIVVDVDVFETDEFNLFPLRVASKNGVIDNVMYNGVDITIDFNKALNVKVGGAIATYKKYKGYRYKIRIGKKGGKFIVVKGDKIYV
jgi:hypothetical protein